jgi:hypothetical protein
VTKQELSKKPPFSRFIAVLISATLMTALFAFLGTPVLRVMRNVFGPWKYWISGVLITAVLLIASPGFLVAGFLLLSLWVTVGVYQEFEERGRSSFWTALFSVLVGSALVILGPYFWAKFLGLNLLDSLRAGLEEVGRQFFEGKSLSDFGISADAVINQIPSMVFLLEATALAFALMLDRKFALLFGLRYEKVASQMRLLEFRVPDFLIWAVMLSFLLSFLGGVPTPVATVASNVFSCLMGAYFFQGLAVMEFSLLVFRVGAIFRLLIYLLVVGQLFFLLSPVGVIDYWVDFRQRLKRWKLSGGNQNNGENV